MLIWESYKMDPYVVKLSQSINIYQEKVEELDLLMTRIEVCGKVFFAFIF